MVEKKLLATVFPYYIDESDEVWLLLCRAINLGVLNGFGGKIEDDEDPADGALRELTEELRIEALRERLAYAGLIKDGLKEIYIYLYRMEEKIEPNPNPKEISESDWRRLSERESYVGEMLSGDNLVLDELEKTLAVAQEPFVIDKTGDSLLDEQTKNLFVQP